MLIRLRMTLALSAKGDLVTVWLSGIVSLGIVELHGVQVYLGRLK